MICQYSLSFSASGGGLFENKDTECHQEGSDTHPECGRFEKIVVLGRLVGAFLIRLHVDDVVLLQMIDG